MNKYIVLSSALVLSACGGGSGTGYISPAPRGAASQAVVQSNNRLTSLATEVLVSNGIDVSPVVFRASTNSNSVTHNGKDYRSYRLEDVNLNVAGTNDLNTQYIKFLINESTGEIRGISKIDTLSGTKPININRIKSTDESVADVFGGPVFEFIGSGSNKVLARVPDNGQITYDQLDARYHPMDTKNQRSSGQWNRVDEKVAFNTYGNDTGLQYSDFGKFKYIYLSKHDNIPNNQILAQIRQYEKTGENKLTRIGDLDSYVTEEEWGEAATNTDGYLFFAGGYAINGTTIADTLTPENSSEYTGTAIGHVNKDGVSKDFITNNAQLNIDASGNQRLTMPFNTASATTDKFYDVTIENPANPTFTFGTSGGVNTDYLRDTGTPTNVEQNWKSGFYGIDTPVEAAGTFHYSETVTDKVWEFQGAYGSTINE